MTGKLTKPQPVLKSVISLFTAESDLPVGLVPQDPSCSQLSEAWHVLLPNPLFTKKVHANNAGTDSK